jgi:hypothetical protein
MLFHILEEVYCLVYYILLYILHSLAFKVSIIIFYNSTSYLISNRCQICYEKGIYHSS